MGKYDYDAAEPRTKAGDGRICMGRWATFYARTNAGLRVAYSWVNLGPVVNPRQPNSCRSVERCTRRLERVRKCIQAR